MLILAIETASSQAGCAIGGHEGVLASAHTGINGKHAENISPQIAFVREQAGIEFSELGAFYKPARALIAPIKAEPP